MSPPSRRVLIGCGILEKEINWLIEKNGWSVDPCFLCSALHTDFDKLHNALDRRLSVYPDDEKIVVYGACHPLIDPLLSSKNARRTPVQNCIELLLGREQFTDALEGGAFFLMEEWARRWDLVTRGVFGNRPSTITDIFHEAHTYLLCLRTPCSEDYSEDAQKVSLKVDLPIVWRDVPLDMMERTLEDLIGK